MSRFQLMREPTTNAPSGSGPSNQPSLVSRLLGRWSGGHGQRCLAEELQCLERVLKSDPESSSTHRQAGIVSGLLGDHHMAKDYLEQAVELDPQDAGAWGNLGMALGILGDHLDAIPCFTRALELDPDDPDAWRGKELAFGLLPAEDLRR